MSILFCEKAKKRDHRKIGKEMDLFMFSDTVVEGLPMWLPKGTALRIRLQDFLRARHPGPLRLSGSNVSAHRRQIPLHLPDTMQNMVRTPFSPYIHRKKGKSTSETDRRAASPLYNLRELRPFLQRPAFAFGRVRYGLPLRAEW